MGFGGGRVGFQSLSSEKGEASKFQDVRGSNIKMAVGQDTQQHMEKQFEAIARVGIEFWSNTKFRQEMTTVYDDSRWFIPWMTHQSITRIHDILDSREPYAFALVGSARGGWHLCDAIADPDDDDGGKVMSQKKFYDKWEGDVKKVFKHLWKNMRAN